MRIFSLTTSASQHLIDDEFLSKLSAFISHLFSVSEKYTLVNVKGGVTMRWGADGDGTFALASLQSTRAINAEQTQQFAPHIFQFLQQHLLIPQNRMYLGFGTLNAENVAIGGQLIHQY